MPRRAEGFGRHNMADVKTGEDHLRSLRDGRAVYIDGERVGDVTTHPAFRNAVRSAAALYDHQARPENLERLTFALEGAAGDGHARVNRCWLMPRNYHQPVERRRAMPERGDVSCGVRGRPPSHARSPHLGP